MAIGVMYCKYCDTTKPLTSFETGRRKCKLCRNIEQNARYQEYPSYKLEHNKRYLENNREKVYAIHNKWSKNNRSVLNRIKANRRLLEKRATPSWYDAVEVKYIYQLASERNLVVDHIVPLQGKLVSGLHVAHNLQYLTPEENSSKGNKFNG